jgi:transcriptional regulator with XRE-family HTH domain
MIGDRIREIREHYKLTQPEFAEKLNLSDGFISQIENGKRKVNDRMIQHIARETEVDEEWLKTGNGIMTFPNANLEEILKQHKKNLDDTDRKIIIEYLKLTPAHRIVIKTFIASMTE